MYRSAIPASGSLRTYFHSSSSGFGKVMALNPRSGPDSVWASRSSGSWLSFTTERSMSRVQAPGRAPYFRCVSLSSRHRAFGDSWERRHDEYQLDIRRCRIGALAPRCEARSPWVEAGGTCNWLKKMEPAVGLEPTTC